VVPLAVKIVDESIKVTAEEQYAFVGRLVTMGRRLEETAERTVE